MSSRKTIPPPFALPQRIRHARRVAQISQAALARAIGIGPSAVAQWELPHGTSPTVDNLLRIALVCDIAFEWLATGRGTPHAPAHAGAGDRPATSTADLLEERLLLAFRRVPSRKRRAFVRWIEELF